MQKAMQEQFKRKARSAQAGARRALSSPRQPLPSPVDMYRPQTITEGTWQVQDAVLKQANQAAKGSHSPQSQTAKKESTSSGNSFLLKGKAVSMTDMEVIPEELPSPVSSVKPDSLTEMTQQVNSSEMDSSPIHSQSTRVVEEHSSPDDRKKSESKTTLSDVELSQPRMSATVTLKTQQSQPEQGAKCQNHTTKRLVLSQFLLYKEF